MSLVNSHREALSKQADVGDTSFFGSPRDAPSFGTARVKSSSQNDAAAFLRRVRATYEQTLQLQEVIIPSLDKRWDAACAERDRLKALKTDLSPQIEAAMKRDCEARKGIEPPPLEPWERAFIKMCEENTPPIVRDCRPMHQRTKPIPGAIPDDHYPQQTFVSQKVEEPKLATHVEGLKGAAAVPWAKVHREAVHRAKLETPSTPSTPAPAPAPAPSMGFGAAFGAALDSPAPAPAAPSSSNYPPMPSKPPSKLPFGTPAPAPAQKKKASPFGGAFALEGLGAALEAKAAAAGAAPAAAPAPAASGGPRRRPYTRGLWRVWSAGAPHRRRRPSRPRAPRHRRLARRGARAARPRRRPSAAAGLPRPASVSGGDARSKVVEIYQKCNPTKLAEVDKLLAKYAGKEAELVLRLQKKYAAQLGSPAAASPFGQTAAPAASPFGQTPAPAAAASPFARSTPAAAASPFGTTQTPAPAASPFGQTPAASPFGGSAPAPAPFGGSAFGSPSTLGAGAAGTSAFGSTSSLGAGAAPAFGSAVEPGRRAGLRDQLGLRGRGRRRARSKVVEIYQKCNPTKLGEVDKLLAKYAGREAELVARLQKKYAAQLGGGAAPAFGQPAALGGGSAFGATSTLGGGGATFGGAAAAPSSASAAWRRGVHGRVWRRRGGADGRWRRGAPTGGFGAPRRRAPAFGSAARRSAAARPSARRRRRAAFGQASGFGGASPGARRRRRRRGRAERRLRRLRRRGRAVAGLRPAATTGVRRRRLRPAAGAAVLHVRAELHAVPGLVV